MCLFDNPSYNSKEISIYGNNIFFIIQWVYSDSEFIIVYLVL